MVAKTPEYLVNHGKTAALGRFLAPSFERFVRGERVVLQSERGISIGVVLGDVTQRQSGLLRLSSQGRVLRRVSPEDEAALQICLAKEHEVFGAARLAASELALPVEVVDCELSLDGRRVILQALIAGSCDANPLLQRLSGDLDLEVWLENLAAPMEEESHGGCGEPGCGRADGGSGCDTCGSGGCTSCGSGKVDMRAYFSHLRNKMDEKRTPLL